MMTKGLLNKLIMGESKADISASSAPLLMSIAERFLLGSAISGLQVLFFLHLFLAIVGSEVKSILGFTKSLLCALRQREEHNAELKWKHINTEGFCPLVFNWSWCSNV